MNFLYFLTIATSIAVFVLIVQMLRNEKLKERHAFWWLGASLVSVVFSIFPQILASISNSLGFGVPSNFLFFASIVVLFLVALQTSTELTKLEENSRTLAEQHAMLLLRVQKLEEQSFPGNS